MRSTDFIDIHIAPLYKHALKHCFFQLLISALSLLLRLDLPEEIAAKLEIEAVLVTASAEEVSRRLANYDLVAMPVIDEFKRLVGVVTVDDVLDHILPDDWRHADDHEESQGTVGAR